METNKPIFFKDFVTSSPKRRDSWKRNLALHHKLSEIKPNDGHHFVKRVLDQKEGIVITQNIDALHEKSGILKEKIIEIHKMLQKQIVLSVEKLQILNYFMSLK